MSDKATLQHINLKPAEQWGGFHPDPLYYYSKKDGKQYLVVLPHYRNSQCIHKYDVINNSWSSDISYGRLQLSGHKAAINNWSNKLYTLGPHSFGIFDLEQNSWNIRYNQYDVEFKKYTVRDSVTNSVGIIELICCPLSMQQLHVFALTEQDVKHLVFDLSKEKYINCISKIGIDIDEEVILKIIYLEIKQKFMIFTTKANIYVSDVKPNSTEYKWNKLDVEIPGYLMSSAIKAAVPAFDDEIVFLFIKTFGESEICCIDLAFNECVLYQDKKVQCRFVIHMCACLGDDYIYMMESYKKFHFKIKLTDILPKALKQRHHERKQLLIFGYIAQIKKSMSTDIPYDLMRLVLCFYSSFQ